MNGINKLKEFKIKDIQKKTYIDATYVKLIMDKDIEALAKLNKTKLNGFLDILEREYEISLEEMRGDFIVSKKDKSKADKKKSTENRRKKITTIPTNIDKSVGKVYLNEESSSSDKRIIFAIVLLGIIAYSYYYFTNKTEILDGNITSQSTQTTQDQTIPDDENSEPEDELFSNTAEETIPESNQTDADNNATNAVLADAKNSENNQTKVEAEVIEVKKIEKITINARKGKVWLGIFYLDTLKKANKMGKNIELDLSRDQLIITGHGRFNTNIDSTETQYDKKAKVRFLYRGNSLSEITKEEYKKLGGGKAW